MPHLAPGIQFPAVLLSLSKCGVLPAQRGPHTAQEIEAHMHGTGGVEGKATPPQQQRHTGHTADLGMRIRLTHQEASE